MSKRPPPSEAITRAAVINGTAPLKLTDRAEFVCLTERHGKRHLRLSDISQVIEDAGQIGGPWFIRCDGQQLPVSVENVQIIKGLLGLNLHEEVKA